MKKITFILFLCAQSVFARYEAHLLFWRNEHTETGAGHCAIAFKTDFGYQYFSHYPKQSGGSINTSLPTLNDVINYDSAVVGLQNNSPQLVLDFQLDSLEYTKMLKKANKLANKEWSLFQLNCADFVKKVFRKGKFYTGKSFLISTPLDLVKDIRAANIHHFKAGVITSRKGFVYQFLKYQPLTIPLVIKKWLRPKLDSKNSQKH